jgi:hypothetical protein
MKFHMIYITMAMKETIMFVELAWPKFKLFNKGQCMIFLNFFNDNYMEYRDIPLSLNNKKSMMYFRNIIIAFTYLSRNANIPMSIDTTMASCAIFNWYRNASRGMMPHVPNIMSKCIIQTFLDNALSRDVRCTIFSFIYDLERCDGSIYARKLNEKISSIGNLDTMLLLANNYKMNAHDIMGKYYDMYGHRMTSVECKRIENNTGNPTKNDMVDIYGLLRGYKPIQRGIEHLNECFKEFGFKRS